MNAYATKTDAIVNEIAPALGEYVNDFDLDGIFYEMFEYSEDAHGFVAVEGVDFYETLARYDVSE